MGSNKVNLTFRFILEITALFAVSSLGFNLHTGITRYFAGLGLPILFAIVWGTFNVPNDPSRSGKAPIKVSGFIRLIIEISIFATAALSFYIFNFVYFTIFTSLVVFHYLISYDRGIWLINQKG